MDGRLTLSTYITQTSWHEHGDLCLNISAETVLLQIYSLINNFWVRLWSPLGKKLDNCNKLINIWSNVYFTVLKYNTSCELCWWFLNIYCMCVYGWGCLQCCQGLTSSNLGSLTDTKTTEKRGCNMSKAQALEMYFGNGLQKGSFKDLYWVLLMSISIKLRQLHSLNHVILHFQCFKDNKKRNIKTSSFLTFTFCWNICYFSIRYNTNYCSNVWGQ